MVFVWGLFLFQAAKKFQKLVAQLAFLVGEAGEDLSVLRVGRLGFVPGEAVHLLAVASAQHRIHRLLRELWGVDGGGSAGDEIAQTLQAGRMGLLLLKHPAEHSALAALRLPGKLQVGSGVRPFPGDEFVKLFHIPLGVGAAAGDPFPHPGGGLAVDGFHRGPP